MTTPDITTLTNQIAELPPGTPVRFDHGTDFTSAPSTFRNTIHRALRNRGWIIASRVHGTSVYIELMSKTPR